MIINITAALISLRIVYTLFHKNILKRKVGAADTLWHGCPDFLLGFTQGCFAAALKMKFIKPGLFFCSFFAHRSQSCNPRLIGL